MRTITSVAILIIAHLPHAVLSQEKFDVFVDDDEKVLLVQSVKAGNTIYISAIVSKMMKTEASIKVIRDGIEKVLNHYGVGYKNVIKETVICDGNCGSDKNKQLMTNVYKEIDGPTFTRLIGKAQLPPSVHFHGYEAELQIDLVVYSPQD